MLEPEAMLAQRHYLKDQNTGLKFSRAFTLKVKKLLEQSNNLTRILARVLLGGKKATKNTLQA